jgi:hypothetical protein
VVALLVGESRVIGFARLSLPGVRAAEAALAFPGEDPEGTGVAIGPAWSGRATSIPGTARPAGEEPGARLAAGSRPLYKHLGSAASQRQPDKLPECPNFPLLHPMGAWSPFGPKVSGLMLHATKKQLQVKQG